MTDFFLKHSLIPIVVLFLFISPDANGAITLDGKLEEGEWADAHQFEKMYTVDPFTLSAPEHDTSVKIISNEQGIYFGIINTQPTTSRINDVTGRDRFITSDSISVIIDFDGDERSAYSFQVGSHGSIRDGILSNENGFSAEWDGHWRAVTSNDEQNWTVELHIPWEIISMKHEHSDHRTIRWVVLRSLPGINKTYASLPTAPEKINFFSTLHPLVIENHDKSSFRVFTSVTSKYDLLGDENQLSVGLDTFWKSRSGKQLNLTINPDFGQIESDNLVVNFEPTEVFFNEKRMFFTENHDLFDIRGANNLRVINTRRIGAPPDVGPGDAADIDFAFRYIDSRNTFKYGVLGASESNNQSYEGRDFFATRATANTQNSSYGVLSTHTKRPELDRHANVIAIDHKYYLNDSLITNSKLFYSDIQQGNQVSNDWGTNFGIEHQLDEHSSQEFLFSHYGKNFEVSDFGYLQRNNINSLSYAGVFADVNVNSQHGIQEKEKFVDFRFQNNTDNEYLGGYLRYIDIWRYANSSSIAWLLEYFSSGKDDLISRGNGTITTEPGMTGKFYFTAASKGLFRFHGNVDYVNTYLQGQGYSTHIHPSLVFSKNYNLSWEFNFTDTNDWINWQHGNIFGSYHRKLFDTTIDLSANLSQKQEFRFRFQWLAIDASANQLLQSNESGELTPVDTNPEDFSISNTALQFRYRYQISPSSNLFVAYSRGGMFRGEESSISEIFDPGIMNVSAENFLIKIRVGII